MDIVTRPRALTNAPSLENRDKGTLQDVTHADPASTDMLAKRQRHQRWSRSISFLGRESASTTLVQDTRHLTSAAFNSPPEWWKTLAALESSSMN